jgi:LPS O-antigen subunit length determinant protein (WzzB/FepE family)
MDARLKAQHEDNRDMNSYDDEIDLFELWNGLVQEKLTIIVVTTVVVFMAALYAFSAPKTYEVTASFLPPYEKDIMELNSVGIVSVSPEKAYQDAIDFLILPTLANDLLAESKVKQIFIETEQLDVKIEALNNSINIQLPIESKAHSLVSDSMLSKVTVQAKSAADAFDISQSIIDLVQKKTKERLASNLELMLDESLRVNTKDYVIENNRIDNELSSEVKRLKEADEESKYRILEKMSLVRDETKQNRFYQIKRLESDYALAKKLGIEQPIDPLHYKKKAKSNTVIDVTSTIPSRYWIGTEILGAEIKSLQERENDDAFIDGLSALKIKLKALEVNHRINTILARKNNEPFSGTLRKLQHKKQQLIEAKNKVVSADFNVILIVQDAMMPSKPVKPKKSLILAVAGVLGLMLGVFIALIRRAVKNRRQVESSVA